MKRLIASIITGLLVSLGLFWLMQTMIMNNQQDFKKTDDLKMVDFVRLKRETRVQTKERHIPEKPPEKRPPPPQMHTRQVHVSQDVPTMDIPNLDIPIQTSRFNIGSVVSGLKMGVSSNSGNISTNVIPLVRIPPRYPMRAANRRIEGWVKVEFTITETGTVKDAKVVEASPSNIFNRAALQAIRKWKFKEKIVDGQAVEQRAIQILQFKLSK